MKTYRFARNPLRELFFPQAHILPWTWSLLACLYFFFCLLISTLEKFIISREHILLSFYPLTTFYAKFSKNYFASHIKRKSSESWKKITMTPVPQIEILHFFFDRGFLEKGTLFMLFWFLDIRFIFILYFGIVNYFLNFITVNDNSIYNMWEYKHFRCSTTFL